MFNQSRFIDGLGRTTWKGKVMIDYAKTEVGDILKLTGAGAPGYANLGDLLRVKERTKCGVMVENKHGEDCEFVFNCGAARLEATEWKNDFPSAD